MMFGQRLNSHRIFKRQAKALIRLRVCAGWSEPLLVAHTTMLEISCHGSLPLGVAFAGLSICNFSVFFFYHMSGPCMVNIWLECELVNTGNQMLLPSTSGLY